MPQTRNRLLPATVLALGLALGLAGCGEQQPTCEVWTYKTRPGEEASRLYVCRVESYVADGKIYHVYIDGLEIPNPHAAGEEDATIPVLTHLPLTEAAFRASVIERVREDAPIPPYRDGYERWKRAFHKNEATAFDIPVAECIGQVGAGLETRSK